MATTKKSPTIVIDMDRAEFAALKAHLTFDRKTLTEFFTAAGRKYLKLKRQRGVGETENLASDEENT